MDQMWSNTIILNDLVNPTRGDFISNWKHIDIVYTYVESRLYWEERERKPLCDISNRITSAAALSQQVMALPMPPIDGICATTIIHIFPCFALLVSLLKAQSHQSITEEFGQKYCGSNLRAASFTLQFVSSSAPSPPKPGSGYCLHIVETACFVSARFFPIDVFQSPHMFGNVQLEMSTK